jgi:hypothetical protein
VEIDTEEQYFIEAVLDLRIHQWKLQYLIKWVGYDKPDWEPAKLHSEREAMDKFHQKYPNKLVPSLYNH